MKRIRNIGWLELLLTLCWLVPAGLRAQEAAEGNGGIRAIQCSGARLTALDVSACPALENLDCGGNQLPALDLSGNPALTALDCSGNPLDTLDVSGCTALENLRAGSEAVERLAIGLHACPGLTALNLSGPQVAVYSDRVALTVTGPVQALRCLDEALTSLNVSACTGLSALNVSGCAALMGLDCSGNLLDTLDVSGCTALENLRAGSEAVERLAIGLRACPNLQALNLSGPQVAVYSDRVALTVTGPVQALRCLDEALTSLNVSGCTDLAGLDLDACTGLSALNVSGCAALTGLDCSDSPLASLNVGGCTSLSALDGSYTQLSALDLGTCTALTSLNVTGCTSLSSLDCSHTQLSGLDVSTCTSLTALDGSHTRLSALNVSGCTALASLDGSHTQLSALDLSTCTALTSLNVSGCTDLAGLDLDACTGLSALNVSGCAALTGLDCSHKPLTSLNVGGCTSLSALDCSHTQLSDLDLSTCTSLSALDCSHTQLSALDVSACTGLERLNCSGNQLSALEVRTCTGLSALDCSYNRLQALDVSACTGLESLDCSGNGLTSLNVGGCRSLTALWCHDNALSTLNVNDGLNLETLMCWNNTLSALDISRNAKLKNLNAANNEMLLSTLAKQLQLVETYGIEHYAASPQTPSVTLEAGEDYDLSREWTFDGEETDITVEDLDGNPLPENWYALDAGQKSIRFNKDGIYRIRLRNLALRCNEYEESTGLFTDERYMMECIITAGVGDLEPETATFAWQAEAAGDKTFSFVCKGGLTVDWGDGATDTYAGSESLAVAASHQYAKAGHYKVQVAAQSFMSGIVGLYIVEAGLTAIDVQAAVSLTALDAHGNRLKLSEVAALIPALDEAGVKHVLTPQARDTTVKVRKKINISAETSFNGTETDIRVYDAEDGEIESGFRLDAKELTFTKAGDYTVRFTNAGLGTYADLTATAQTAAEMVWQVTVTPSSPSTPSDPSDPSDPGKPSNPGNPGTPSDPTANEQASAAAPFAYVQGSTVYLCDGLGEVEAFTAMGQRVYKGFDRAFTLPHIGIYVVRVTADGRRCKIIVR